MRSKSFIVGTVAVLALFINSENVHSQSPGTDEKKFELGGQFSILQSPLPVATFTGIVCVRAPCPSTVISDSRESQPGFGGRIGYNLTKNVALEAELNFFPNADSFSVPEDFKGGHKLEGLFGVKIGKRFDKVGIFGKARPGFLYASKGDLQRASAVCITTFPTPAPCFETTGKSNFAFDLGGVVEIYPTKRTFIRFDAGDTIVSLSDRNVPLVFGPGSVFVSVVSAPAKTTHNFQGSVGIGFRF